MSYLLLHREGKLKGLSAELLKRLACCTLCPRNCRVNRLEAQKGFCQTLDKAIVSSAFLHFGEEPELVGRGGSGTIFFAYCNLGCLYCQNHSISHSGEGRTVSAEELATLMVHLQEQGAENINLVTPSHVVAQIVAALVIAADMGLKLPLVYNCGGYESLETLRLIEGVFDIYMPDFKYSQSAPAQRFSSAPDYWEIAQAAVQEMHRQVGDLVVEEGRARKGLLIRHLVLPHKLAGSFKILDFIKDELSLNTYVNIMRQYYPCYRASEFKELGRRINTAEYREVVEYAQHIGLNREF